jgi:isoquinoline 1-oxidoreductase beta subunit
VTRGARATELSRREFVRLSASAAGGLVIAFALPGCGKALTGRTPAESSRLNGFLAIDTDGIATVTIPVPEVGQGVRTSLAMLVAEELEIPWEDVRVKQADAAASLGPHPFAGGSWSVRGYWEPLREAGATAREALKGAAAARWNADPETCTAVGGRVQHRASRRTASYGELAAEAASRPIPQQVELKRPSDFRIIGTSRRNLDSEQIVRGSAEFGLDVRVPGMLRAVVSRCPAYGGTVRRIQDEAARRVPGVREVVRIAALGDAERPYVPEGVAVLADSTWAAMQGRDVLRVEWDTGPNAGESTDRLHARCQTLLASRAPTYLESGSVDAGLRRAAVRVDATYQVPFIAHAPMEPMNCVVHVRDGGCEIWAPTQIPVPVRGAVARRLELPEEAVIVNVTRVGGGFGRRLSADFVLEAVQVAQAVPAPVQVVWTREDDMRHGFLRPFSHHRLIGGLDAAGNLTSLLYRQAGTSRYAFRDGQAPGRSEFRAGTYPAALVPHYRLEYALAESNLSRGPLRAPGLNAFAFAAESFIDEAAHAAGRDPLEFRLGLLGAPRDLPYDEDDPLFSTARMAQVFRAAARAGDWGRPLPAGRGRGIAGAFTFGSYAAHVVEVSVDPTSGQVRCHRVSSAIDCGRAVNPNGVRAQVEGGVIDGLSAALHAEITVEEGRIMQSNFHDFALLRCSQAPEIAVHIVGSEAAPTGVGEPPYPPVAPAIANAIFAATGARVRELPFGAARVRRAVEAAAVARSTP